LWDSKAELWITGKSLTAEEPPITWSKNRERKGGIGAFAFFSILSLNLNPYFTSVILFTSLNEVLPSDPVTVRR